MTLDQAIFLTFFAGFVLIQSEIVFMFFAKIK